MEQNRFKRLLQHWLHPRFRVERYFPQTGLQNIGSAIARSETAHAGQIRFVVESGYPAYAVLSGLQPRARAWQWFGELGVWDTEMNSGVLVYVSFADHAVEIVADRGITAKVDDEVWAEVCALMRDNFKQGNFVPGLEQGLNRITEILTAAFPKSEAHVAGDELPNDVVLY